MLGFFFGNNYTHLFKLSLLCNIMVESDLEDSATHSFKLEEWIAKGESFIKKTYDADVGCTEDGRNGRIGATRYAGGNGTRKEAEKRNV